MTNQEHIEMMYSIRAYLTSGNPIWDSSKIAEACNAAISVLQAQEAKTQLSAEGTTSDLISRQEAIEVADAVWCVTGDVNVAKVWDQLKNLPSAQPERKTGRWLIREGISDAQCSECKMYFRDVYDMDNSDAFCRHCGAKMEGLKVVEDE